METPVDFEHELINVDLIHEIPDKYPDEFIEFCVINELNPPDISSGNGKALSLMLRYNKNYFNRKTCNKICKKFNIETKDSIQLFNKQNQWGIKTSSDLRKRGKYFIPSPYSLSNKHKMRKGFKFDGTEEQKNSEIEKIKSTIKEDYVDVPNWLWQLGHKNPGSTDNSSENLVLQPPIQAKYRDDFIFIDTLTKFPVPHRLKIMIEKEEIEFTDEQIDDYIQLFTKLKAPV
jgi:hypothetical protein